MFKWDYAMLGKKVSWSYLLLDLDLYSPNSDPSGE